MRDSPNTIVVIERLETRMCLSAAPTGLTPAQVRHAYGFDQLAFTDVNNSVFHADGSGQTIAIVDAYGAPTIANDFKVFSRTFGLPTTDAYGKFALTTVALGKPRMNAGWALEQALDVEWAHAIAPSAHILLVQARSATTGNLLKAIDYARKQPGVVTVSLSWGGDESPFDRLYENYLLTPRGHVGGSGLRGGVTFVTASGDSGAPASWPAVSPNVVAVGGTTLKLDANGNWAGEVGWSGSGGGISIYQPVPTHSPDVALNADPATGYSVYTSRLGWRTVGGTSAAAPQWAALIALADQARNLKGLGSMGTQQTLQGIYSAPASDFHDITSGNNGFQAGPGYDLVTGRGTPIAQYLVPDLAGTSTSLSAQIAAQVAAHGGRSQRTLPLFNHDKLIAA